ncbi:hypothetical protein EDD15DRAFT_2295984, partial [Pisolithus albus]
LGPLLALTFLMSGYLRQIRIETGAIRSQYERSPDWASISYQRHFLALDSASPTMSEFRKSTSSRIRYAGLHNLRGSPALHLITSHSVVLRERFVQKCRHGIVRIFFDVGMPVPCVCIMHIRG